MLFRSRSRLLSIAVRVLVALAAPRPGARADDYSDPAYLQHDIDNVSRALASGRQVASLLDPEYAAAFAPAAAETFLTNLGRQVDDAPRGRVYATLGPPLPQGLLGDPLQHRPMTHHPVMYLSPHDPPPHGRLRSHGTPAPHPPRLH